MRRAVTLAAGVAFLLHAGGDGALAAPPNDLKTAPTGFMEMYVGGVMPSGEGHTVVLVSPEEEMLLPLGIGFAEALAIHGRLEHIPFGRPMTHDLLDVVLARLGGKVVRVQIDDLRDDVFVGTVFILTGKETVAVDARPSDAIALALSSEAPIFVARRVIERAALHAADLAAPPEVPTPPAFEPKVLRL